MRREHEIHDLWWKNAVIYCLDVEAFCDSDGDGIGDFGGLIRRLDHLSRLGVTCIWLMPFYPTPNHDDGYDVSDYYSVDSRLGDLGDFTEFMRAAENLGIRVIADLVINHTSTEHPWFQAARTGPESPYHDYYVWQDERPEDWHTELIFPGQQEENWTYDRSARRYYLHRFYRHQPDLNPANPELRREMKQIISFWVQQGLSGFRVDAAPFLIELDGITGELDITEHGFLRDLTAHLKRRRGDGILLGEVNLHPRDQVEFFGGDGDELNMMFGFYVNQYLHLALARRDADPLRKALEALPQIPETCQWANFITNHDELTLDKLTEAERQEVFEAFGPSEDMQIFGRGIRRRLPPMLGGDRRLLELAYSLLFGLPGTPVLFYGEEIGMGENLEIAGRRAVRTPMQWTDEPSAGFSEASPDELFRPLPSGDFAPDRINVEDQLRDPESFLTWLTRLVRIRRECPEIGHGAWSLVDAGSDAVLAHRCELEDRIFLALHNLGDESVEVDVSGDLEGVEALQEIWSDAEYGDLDVRSLTVDAGGYRWLRCRPA